ncbi:YopX family protein [Companilactobacillus sp.]|uniref:YopX family protein n=1 Tax=Companilactobacillus sp. TaxID=2767905 RepID=UPI002601D342|nr:YopX family protein [Companilactobacillus sp.]
MIKFRAWDKRTECYLYDIQDAYDTLSGFVKYDDGENADYNEDCFGAFLNNKRYDVEQFTGLTDVNGNDIYVGDIVEATIDGAVQADKYLVKNVWDPHVWTEESDGYYAVSKMKVQGNVHENPELLVEDHA